MEIMLEEVVLALNKNGFGAHVAHDADEALDLAIDIIERESPDRVTLGSSLSLRTTGIYNLLKNSPSIRLVDTADIIRGLVENPKDEALLKQIHLSMTSDLFFCGANAIIANGQLVNLDQVGNRISSLIFGPKRVVVVAGRNKIVPDLTSAVSRIKNISAPLNAKRLKYDVPCVAAGKCMNCDKPQRICNTWAITEKCMPKGRVTVILVDVNLGL